MQVSARSYLTAGVALAGAGAIALSPVQPLPSQAEILNNRSSAVELAATTWSSVFQNSVDNLEGLYQSWGEAPLPILQQALVNQIAYLNDVPDFESILGQIVDNLGAAVTAPFAPDVGVLGKPAANPLALILTLILAPDTVDTGGLDALHGLIYYAMTQGVPGLGEGDPPLFAPIIPAELLPVFGLLTTSLSGVALGLVGPVVAPVLALGAGLQAAIDAPDAEAAFEALTSIPAAMTDAFLNGGQTLDLTPLVSLLGSDLLPEGTKIGITLGGLLSPGGNIFNALDLKVPFSLGGSDPIELAIPGQGPGAIGSLVDLSQTIAKAIGWGGEGNPLNPPALTASTSRVSETNTLAAGEVPKSVLGERTTTVTVTPTLTDLGSSTGQKEEGLTVDEAKDSTNLAKNARAELKNARESVREAARDIRDSVRNTVSGVRDSIRKATGIGKNRATPEKADQSPAPAKADAAE